MLILWLLLLLLLVGTSVAACVSLFSSWFFVLLAMSSFDLILEHGLFARMCALCAAPYARRNNVHHVYVCNYFYRCFIVCVYPFVCVFNVVFICCRCMLLFFCFTPFYSFCFCFYLFDSKVVNEVRAQ